MKALPTFLSDLDELPEIYQDVLEEKQDEYLEENPNSTYLPETLVCPFCGGYSLIDWDLTENGDKILKCFDCEAVFPLEDVEIA